MTLYYAWSHSPTQQICYQLLKGVIDLINAHLSVTITKKVNQMPVVNWLHKTHGGLDQLEYRFLSERISLSSIEDVHKF
jgi:hypothetical protein